jgi:hypothetical protein
MGYVSAKLLYFVLSFLVTFFILYEIYY